MAYAGAVSHQTPFPLSGMARLVGHDPGVARGACLRTKSTQRMVQPGAGDTKFC